MTVKTYQSLLRAYHTEQPAWVVTLLSLSCLFVCVIFLTCLTLADF